MQLTKATIKIQYRTNVDKMGKKKSTRKKPIIELFRVKVFVRISHRQNCQWLIELRPRLIKLHRIFRFSILLRRLFLKLKIPLISLQVSNFCDKKNSCSISNESRRSLISIFVDIGYDVRRQMFTLKRKEESDVLDRIETSRGYVKEKGLGDTSIYRVYKLIVVFALM